MSSALLDSIEWHDRPVAALSVTGSGVELLVTPWVEAAGAYARYALRITEAEKLGVNLTGALSAQDLNALEVSTLDYALSSTGRISGTIGILPGEAGYWTISFRNAIWSFEAV